jgi:hypothetical protein
MKLKYHGDSYDHVKRVLLETAADAPDRAAVSNTRSDKSMDTDEDEHAPRE